MPNLPNLLTWLRILLIPVVVGVYYLPGWFTLDTANHIATGAFLLAALTDWLDGWLARKLGQTSPFGAFLDPVADKLMVVAALVVLVDLGRAGPIVALVIIGRELTISALREWMAQLGRSASVAVSYVGKLKTAAQMTALSLLLYDAPLFGLPISLIGLWLLDVAAVLTLVSMLYYLHKARQTLAQNR
jgi:CDP-diacylglycerol--glycerol-3-phosphate 3-phosphatidyltransferase/cardiolipin synthase